MDAGTLMCWATNPVGRQGAPCQFHLVPARRPAPVHNCSSSSTSTTTPNADNPSTEEAVAASAGGTGESIPIHAGGGFKIACEPGFGGGLQQVTATCLILVIISNKYE